MAADVDDAGLISARLTSVMRGRQRACGSGWAGARYSVDPEPAKMLGAQARQHSMPTASLGQSLGFEFGVGMDSGRNIWPSGRRPRSQFRTCHKQTCMHEGTQACTRARMHRHTFMYVHMHTPVCVQMHTHMQTNKKACIHMLPTYMNTYMHTYPHTHKPLCTHACMHTCTHAYVHTCIHACMHSCVHTYMIHTYTCA